MLPLSAQMVARICDGITTLSGYDGNDEFSEELWTCSARGASLEGSKLSLEVQVLTIARKCLSVSWRYLRLFPRARGARNAMNSNVKSLGVAACPHRIARPQLTI